MRGLCYALAGASIAAPAAAQDHQHSPAAEAAPTAAAPAAPSDHAADRYYDPQAMAHARGMAREEMGGMRFSKVMLNLAEYQSSPKGDGYRWDGRAWYGGDLNRLVLRSEGEAGLHDLEAGEVQALYSRAVGPYADVHAGVRQDFAPVGRTYAAFGVESLLPYWFDVEGAVFVSTKGEVLARAEGSYDLRLLQRVVLQPRAELNFAAQDIRATRMGSGLSTAELGLRLRYELRHELAPYVGVSWEKRFGRTAGFARTEGRPVEAASLVAGLRFWF